jgi:aspartate kinase
LIKAMKFGGTSVGSEKALRSLTAIIEKDTAKKAVVVSAMSGVTNLLIGWMNDRKQPLDPFLDELLRKHTTVVRCMLSTQEMDELETKLRVRLTGLRQNMGRFDDPHSRSYAHDAIASWGERLSSVMVTALLRAAGVDAIALTSEEAGIVASGPPGSGTADLDATARNFRTAVTPLIESGKTPIITGYYGMDSMGRPLTFGRGGSDYSGAVVAYALNASVLEIWTDVDGFMSADPRIIPEAKTISEMDYGEAAELAYFGATVLHPRTIEPARKKKIPVLVKNTFNPDAPGTRIIERKGAGTSMLKSVAVKSDLSIVKFYSSEIAYSPGLVTEILGTVNEDGVTMYAISTSLSTLALAVPSSSVKDICERIRKVQGGQIEKVRLKDNVSLICAVGDDMINTKGVSAKVFKVAEEMDANIEMISEGASDVALNFVVPSDKAVGVARKLHERFIGA